MGCGPENPHGLHLNVYWHGDVIFSDVIFDERQIGAPGLAHGGAVAAACDDVLGFTPWIVGAPAVTRSLTVEYLLPTPLWKPHRIVAKVTGRKNRSISLEALGTGMDGIVRFRATAVFVAVTIEHFAAHGDTSEFGALLARFDRTGGHTAVDHQS
jgi:acyl-coenzyme A thioesterase PaaI-like protein